MSWLTNFVRPKIRALVGKTDVPDNLWQKCPACDQMLFHRELESNLFVCNHCNHHLRLSATQRLDQLFDDGDYTCIELPAVVADPLKFRDRKRYVDHLKDAQAKTQQDEAVMVAHGKLGGHDAVIAAFNFGFMGGSMGIAAGEAMIAAARLAKLQEAPLIVVPSSGGARMQEGLFSLVQMPRTILAVNEVREAGLPYLVVLADPTTGGTLASFAMLGDIHIAEPNATIGFTGARVIERTIREALPEGFQRSEYLLDHGVVDMVVNRHELRGMLIRIVDLLMRRQPQAEIVPLNSGDMEIPAPKQVEIDPEKEAVADLAADD
ncbi:MAG: acetyl-CoA carboxylase, carboxyltransferase subunit beta [Alphaproteobacteria bacterium]